MHLVPPTFTAAAQETLVYCLALEAGEAYVPSPWDCIISVTKKGVHTPVWHPDICSCYQGTLYTWHPVGRLLVGPKG